MEKIEGFVSGIDRQKKETVNGPKPWTAFFVNGKKLSMFDGLEDLKNGDYAEVDYEVNGIYNNAKKVVVKKAPTGSLPSAAPAPYAGDRKIVREVALKAAVELVASPSSDPGKATVENVLVIADRFTDWINKV